ncbi:Mce family protein [Gordonia araii NBRC 100433]|uniref:Mce family protein n=1 Tax=Gordonia araii NBRC 100433 TaxID=1073574 RepID=G7H7G0_9ACTN|nr:MCE family protein [Gordonia araii]NNG98468.1 MCE family protein [Gordonia araii NBRC 100433]GAB11785.1 Mce family protein [Gordonia araii NBRC 100433]
MSALDENTETKAAGRGWSPRALLRRLSDRPAMSNAQRERMEMRWGIASAVVLLVMGLVAAGIYVFTPGQARLTAQFDEAGQIKAGDSVRVAGVPVGTVKKVTLADDHVVVEMSVARDVFIGEDSRADAKMLTVVGGNFIDITSAGNERLRDKPIAKDNTSVPYSLTKTFSLAQPKIEAIDAAPLRKTLVQVQEGFAANPGALKRNLSVMQSMLTNLNNRQDEFGTMLSLAAEYTQSINVSGDILTALGRNLADFVTEFESYGTRLSYAFQRLADLLERVKGILLEYDTTIDPLVRQVDAIGRKFGPLLERYEPMIKQGRDLIKRLQSMVGPDGSIRVDQSNIVLSTDYCMPVPGVKC